MQIVGLVKRHRRDLAVGIRWRNRENGRKDRDTNSQCSAGFMRDLNHLLLSSKRIASSTDTRSTPYGPVISIVADLPVQERKWRDKCEDHTHHYAISIVLG